MSESNCQYIVRPQSEVTIVQIRIHEVPEDIKLWHLSIIYVLPHAPSHTCCNVSYFYKHRCNAHNFGYRAQKANGLDLEEYLICVIESDYIKRLNCS